MDTGPLRQSLRMVKRTVAAVLWLLAVWTPVSAITMFTGLPSVLAPAAGLLVAALVWWDPTGLLWGPRGYDAKIVHRRIADLQRVPESVPDHELRPGADTAQG